MGAVRREGTELELEAAGCAVDEVEVLDGVANGHQYIEHAVEVLTEELRSVVEGVMQAKEHLPH